MTEARPNCGSGVHAAKAHGSDLRKGRVSEPGRIYLVTTTTHNRQRFFDDFHLGWVVVGAMRHHDRTGNTDTLAYVVMPDHLHWLFSLGVGSSLDKVPDAYRRYLESWFREQFGLLGTPLRIEFRSAANPYAPRDERRP